MKKRLIPIAALALLVLAYSCKDKAKEAATDTTTQTAQPATTPAATATTPANEPKTYAVALSPDTVQLGKDKEVFVKIKNAKAVALQDPDGKDEGIEVSFDMDVSNKNKVGGNSIFFRPDFFRMTLDNGNNITQYSGTGDGVDAESTKEFKGVTYKIPSGAKPKTLNLFHDQTRASVGLELK